MSGKNNVWFVTGAGRGSSGRRSPRRRVGRRDRGSDRLLEGWVPGDHRRRLEHLRRTGRGKETLNIVYIVDDRGRLLEDLRLGGLVLADNQISGGQSIPLFVDPAGMTDAQKAKWPQLAGYTMFRLRSQDLGLVPNILKGQMAVAAGPRQATAPLRSFLDSGARKPGLEIPAASGGKHYLSVRGSAAETEYAVGDPTASLPSAVAYRYVETVFD